MAVRRTNYKAAPYKKGEAHQINPLPLEGGRARRAGSKLAKPIYYALFLWKRVPEGRVIAGT